MGRWNIIGRVPAPVALVIWGFAALTVMVAIFVPFPSSYDELQHFSVVREQFDHPALFGDPSRYFVLNPHDLAHKSMTRNYINHPSLYYLVMSAYLSVTDNLLVGRLINSVMAAGTLMLVVWAGLSYFPTRFGQACFAVLSASFPKAALVGGMINNDNLAGLAAAMVFAGLLRGGGWMLGIGLALAGWSKLTAIVALGVTVLVQRCWAALSSRQLHVADQLPVIAGMLIGLLPYIVNLIQTGHVLYINDLASMAAPGKRPDLDMGGYAANFFYMIVMKWGASEYALPFAVAALLLATPLVLAGLGIAGNRAAAKFCIPYAAAIAVTLAIHFWYGWSAFERIGDQTAAQTRYYNVLWPGVAFAAASGIGVAAKTWRPLGPALLALCVAPTMIGSLLLAIVSS
jgi:hypothetical protein